MKKQLSIWQLINDALVQHIPVMLLYVLESKGSSPGRQGFFMAVTGNGDVSGSIGGGIMENKFLDMAKENLKHDNQVLYLRKQIHDKRAAKNQSGMICSGEQTILVYRVGTKDILTIRWIVDCLARGKNGTLQFSPAGFSCSTDSPENDFMFHFKSDDDWNYTEKLGYKNHLYIVGGGHCSLAFSKIMSTMDFFIHLYDHRKDLLTYSENLYVNQRQLLKDYYDLENLVEPGENNYVVVMTVGYRTDDVAIRTLMNKAFKYFGVLGSQKKIEKMFSDYRKEGIPEAVLEKIHAPIGLAINSQTPEEIAISIAAQIIQVKNKTAEGLPQTAKRQASC
jgi:xanthine dehydrogenase accessory factor